MQTPQNKTPTDFTADDDLAVVYKGKLLELEKEADTRVFKKADQARTKGLLLGIIGSLAAIFGSMALKSLWSSISSRIQFKKPEQKT